MWYTDIMANLKKILYVEDQKDIQLIVQVALESISNYDLTICSGGEEALTIVSELSPDLLLLDVMMPDMDGPTLLAEIRKREDLKKIPVIFITAKVLPNEIDALMSLGALSVIEKPFNPVTLGNNIQAIWDNYIAPNS